MGFKLRDFSDLVGIDKDTSSYGTPVFKKDLGGEVMAEANNDGTIFVDKSLSKKEKEDAVAHEKVHLDQMAQGKLQYDNNTVTWKKDTRSPARVYKRIDGKIVDAKTSKAAGEGDKNFEWEDEAYKNS
jgi:hypothetical protein